MIKGIDNPKNKELIAIVAVGYNRLAALKRLLNSLNGAHYPNNNIPLVISIDASGDENVYNYVRFFEWNHGTKYVNIQEKRLGLKNHIFQCGDLTRFFRGVIILEDDLFVSPFFYHYAISTMACYEHDDKVAGIALYRNEYDGYTGTPIHLMYSGYDVFAWQAVCSWGEMYNERMWSDFRTWLDTWDGDFGPIKMSNTIKAWTKAWSKFFYAYLISTNRYFIYPYESVTTNFDDAGGEHVGGNTEVQVSMVMGKRNYQLSNFEELVHYDVNLCNESIYKWLNIDINNLTIDFNGQVPFYQGRYVLSPFKLPYNVIKGYKLTMRPWELNVKYAIEGNDLFLYDRGTIEKEAPPVRHYNYNILSYFFDRYDSQYSIRYLFYLLMRRLGVLLKI